MKQFSPACERNREPILAVLREHFAQCSRVLEIGSGSGQHAVWFAAHLPHLQWQPTDRSENHPSICAWSAEAGLPNLLPPIELDVTRSTWPQQQFDAVFSANTTHIMAWEEVQAMLRGIGQILQAGGLLGIYGPFNRGGFTSEGNARFDAALKAQAPHMGLRELADMQALASQHGLQLEADIPMPANNQFLLWRRTTVAGVTAADAVAGRRRD